jgi:ribosome-associated translation inhibitor RaiA
VLETLEAREFIGLFGELRANRAHERALRQAGRQTAKQYTWSWIAQRLLFPWLRLVATHSVAEASGPQRASGKRAGMCYRIRGQHTKMAPPLLGWIAERLEDLNTPDEDVLHAHVTLVKHQEWRRNRYEARVELTLAARRLQAVQVAKTPYEAMVAALKAVERKLRALRALEGAAAVPISPTRCKSPSHERRSSFSHEGDTDEGAGHPIRHC